MRLAILSAFSESLAPMVSSDSIARLAGRGWNRRMGATAVILFLAIASVDSAVLWRTRDRHLGISEDHFDKGVLLYQTGSLSPDQVPMVFRPPGYPVFVAGTLTLSGAARDLVAVMLRRPPPRIGFRVAVLVSHVALMGLTGVALFVFLAHRTGSLVAVLAAVATACSPILLIVATQVSYPMLHIAVLVVASMALLRSIDRDSPGALAVFGSGLLWGLATLIKPVTLVTPIFIALWAWPHLGLKRALATTAAFTLGLVAAVTPYTIRNYVETGRFIPVNQQASFALWATSLQRVAPEQDYLNWVELWFQSGMSVYTKVTGEPSYLPAAYEHHLLELSDRFETMAWANVRERPAVYLYNVVHNAFRFVVDSPARFWFRSYFERAGLQKQPGRFLGQASLWMLTLAAVVGIGIGCLRRARQETLLVALFAVMWASHSATFLEPRYLYVELPTVFIGFAMALISLSEAPELPARHRLALTLTAGAAAVSLAGLFFI
jgi:hypothetical protein